MRKFFGLLIVILFLTHNVTAEKFRFAFLTDLHVQMVNPKPAEDLENAVSEVNLDPTIEFVLVGGDVSETGDLASLQRAKSILDKLKVPYYATSGNHETKWSESAATDFAKVFGSDRFNFMYKGFRFIAFNTGPVIKMGDGHIAQQDVKWVNEILQKDIKNTPVIVVTHYPLQNGDVDNWYAMTDVLRKYNIQAVLDGHYHRNAALSYDGLPGIVNRSTLSATNPVGGYTIYTVGDSIQVAEKKIGIEPKVWLNFAVENKEYEKPDFAIRPSFAINTKYKNVKVKWEIENGSPVFTAPAVGKGLAFYGDDLGNCFAVKLSNGKVKWKFETGMRIISSPAYSADKVVFASSNGKIYCLNAATGSKEWEFATPRAVMGCPVIHNDTIFLGGSDGNFRALSLKSGNEFWRFGGIGGYIETKPLIVGDEVVFGAWDTNLYAVSRKSGALVWKWNNGSASKHFSPAAVWPVSSNGKIFIAAPDRFLTALDANTGKVIWRTNKHEARESIGLSNDGKILFSRSMNDSIVAIDAVGGEGAVKWKNYIGFGYDINSCSLTDNNGTLIWGTKNGLISGVDTATGKIKWQYKLGNSIVNTVVPVSKNEILVTNTEGIVTRLKY